MGTEWIPLDPEVIEMGNVVKFQDSRLGVFCCGHIFRRERPANFVMHQDVNYWQFLCGEVDHNDPNEPYHVCVGTLLEVDPSLNELANLPIEWEAERKKLGALWVRNHSKDVER